MTATTALYYVDNPRMAFHNGIRVYKGTEIPYHMHIETSFFQELLRKGGEKVYAFEKRKSLILRILVLIPEDVFEILRLKYVNRHYLNKNKKADTWEWFDYDPRTGWFPEIKKLDFTKPLKPQIKLLDNY